MHLLKKSNEALKKCLQTGLLATCLLLLNGCATINWEALEQTIETHGYTR